MSVSPYQQQGEALSIPERHQSTVAEIQADQGATVVLPEALHQRMIDSSAHVPAPQELDELEAMFHSGKAAELSRRTKTALDAHPGCADYLLLTARIFAAGGIWNKCLRSLNLLDFLGHRLLGSDRIRKVASERLGVSEAQSYSVYDYRKI